MPHVLAVVEQFWHRLPGGTARSTERTLAALMAESPYTVTGVAARHRDRRPEPGGRQVGYRMPGSAPVVHHRLPRPLLYESWLRLGRPSVDRWCRPDTAVWASSLIVPPTSRPVLATVHDLDFLRYSQYLTRRGRDFFPRMWRVARERADRFVCPSASVADDVAEQGIGRERIEVVPWGVDRPRCPTGESVDVVSRLGLEPGYVLVVAGMTPRKNPEGILTAVAAVDCRVVLVGPSTHDPTLQALLDGLDQRAVTVGDVDDRTLSALYREAGVLLYPSHREGFGLPVLEAMIHGTAVITSAGTATEEAAGEAALLVDPADHRSIIDALGRVIGDSELRSDLERRGLARAAEMTWERTAGGYAAAFDRLVEAGPSGRGRR